MNFWVLAVFFCNLGLLRVAQTQRESNNLLSSFLSLFRSTDFKALELEIILVVNNIGEDELKAFPAASEVAILKSVNSISELENDSGALVLMTYEANTTLQDLDAILSTNSSKLSSTKAFTILVLCENENSKKTLISKVLSMAQAWELDISSKFYIASLRSTLDTRINSTISLTEVYNIKNITVSNVFVVEHSASNTNIFQELNDKLKRRLNLRGVHFIGVSELKPGLVEEQVNGEVAFIGGYNVEEYRCLRDALNFTEITVPWKGYVGMDSNGCLTGMGQQVHTGEADISIQSQEILLYRAQRLTFLVPNLHNIEKLYAFFQQRRATSQGNIFLQTFGFEIWMVSMVIWIILSSSILVLHKVNKRFRRLGPPDQCCIPSTVGMWGVATICQKGWHTLPSRPPMRIVIITGLFASYMFYQAFCASLVALLSVPPVLIHSFNDLVKYEFNLYTEKDTNAAHALVQNLQPENLRKPSKSKNAYHGLSATEGLVKILTSKSAFISPVYLFYPKIPAVYSPGFLCQHVTKEDAHYDSTKSGMFIKKNSPFKELFYYKLIQMTERGIRHRLSKRYRIDGVILNCLPQDGTSSRESIEFQEVLAAFVILSLSIPVSITILIMELYQGRLSSKSRTK